MAGAALSDQRAADAQSSAVGVIAQEKFGCPEEPRDTEDGGSLCASDWFAHVPLALAAVAIVIVADGAAIAYIIRNRWRHA